MGALKVNMWLTFGGFAGLSVLVFLLRKKIGLFWSAAAFFVATFLFTKYGLEPPAPASVVGMYGATALIATFLYVTSGESGRTAFWAPIRAIMVEKRLRPLLALMLLLLPGVVAWQTYVANLPPDAPPPRIRSVHPSPPSTIPFTPPDGKGRTVDLLGEDSPVGKAAKTDAEAFQAHLAKGKAVYYQNCFYCHGDHMSADGHYASAVKPPPISFQDPGTIAMLQEAFLFWRVAKGGPGLPDEGTPWDSSMPVWEKFLGEEEIWQVIAYLYDHTGYQPRGRDVHAAEGTH